MRLPPLPASLRGRLLALLLIASLPVLALAAIGIAASWREAMHQAEERLAAQRHYALTSNRAKMEAAQALLGTLALAAPGAIVRCDQLLAPAQALGLQPVIVAADGATVCGRPAQATARMQGAASRIEPGGHGAILLSHPLPDGAGFVAAQVPLSAPDPETGLWLLDSRRTGPLLASGGGAPPPPVLPHGPDPVWLTAADGTTWLAARGSLAPGLDLLVARPEGPLRQAASVQALRRFGELLALLAVGGVAVFLGLGVLVTRPLAQLRTAVGKWTSGEPAELAFVAHLPEELRELAESFRRGATALAERDVALQEAIARAELLAEEVHHRVKNNLQIVSSLLALQAGRVADPAARAEFEATRDRVAALATLHRHMYLHHDPDAIDPRAFLQELGEQLFAAIGERPGRRIAFEVEATPLRIASDQAVPLALLITETVSAALKHGFPDGRRGRITIRLASTDSRAQLTITDDGIWPRADDRLRASLMRGFARQLGSELRAEEGRVALDLPLRPPLPRQVARLRTAG